MNTETYKSQAALEQLADLTQILEKEKVQLTPEVEEYVREHVRAVQDKLQAGQDVYEKDLEFIAKVRTWVTMPKELREKYPRVEEMVKSEEVIYLKPEAYKRNISIKQWEILLHTAKMRTMMWTVGKVTEKDKKVMEKEWIDRNVIFPGNGKIKFKTDFALPGCTELTELPDELSVGGALLLRGCTGLTGLPKGLSVEGNLDLAGCTGLTKLPEGLSVSENSYLSVNLNEQVKKDAERLKKEGKIHGEIIGGSETEKQPVLSSSVNKIRNFFKSLLK